MIRFSVIGFDSAWAGRKPGAVCAVRRDEKGGFEFISPILASFDQALEFVREEQGKCDICLVCLDQPTIVPNYEGARPVDRVAASLVSWLGGGVQPANRARSGLFDDAAPIWQFIRRLGAIEDPNRARTAKTGLFLIEVFPALALPTMVPDCNARKAALRYNPARKTFRLDDWGRVVDAVDTTGTDVRGLKEWCREYRQNGKPGKCHQDKLDAVICALIGITWLTAPPVRSIMIGDLKRGYMVAPVSAEVRDHLMRAAACRRVPVDGLVPTESSH